MSTALTLTVVEANRTDDGNLLVTFSDETTTLFRAEFLYDVRSHDGNTAIADPPAD
jgi:hypothetical protein